MPLTVEGGLSDRTAMADQFLTLGAFVLVCRTVRNQLWFFVFVSETRSQLSWMQADFRLSSLFISHHHPRTIWEK